MFNIPFLWLQAVRNFVHLDNEVDLKRKPSFIWRRREKMSSSEREKALDRAMRRLTPTFMRKLSPDVRHELYGREQLTWMEYERIGR